MVTNNTVNSGVVGYGGGIAVYYWHCLNIGGTTFSCNQALGMSTAGGALLLSAVTEFACANLSGNTFSTNKVRPWDGSNELGAGGAVAIFDAGGFVASSGNIYKGNQRSCPFLECEGQLSFILFYFIFFFVCLFFTLLDNSVYGGNSPIMAGMAAGGAFWRGNSMPGAAQDTSFASDTFRRNKALGGNGMSSEALQEVGGGIGIGGALAVTITNGNLFLRNCSFTDNAARGGDGYEPEGTGLSGGDAGDAMGGALFMSAKSGAIRITEGCRFEANRAQGGMPGGLSSGNQWLAGPGKAPSVGGGAIYASQGVSLSADSTEFEANEVALSSDALLSGSEGFGGAIFVGSSGLILSAISFLNNSVTSEQPWGGAIFASVLHNAAQCNFTGNRILGRWARGGAVALGGGGGEEEEEESPSVSLGTFVDCNFDSNTALAASMNDTNGGGLFVAAGSIVATGCRFVNNVAGYGGALFLAHPSAVGTPFDVAFENNCAHVAGGGIFVMFDDAEAVPPVLHKCCANLKEADLVSCTFAQTNTAPYGSDCASNAKSLLLVIDGDDHQEQNGSTQTITNALVWPGQTFGLSLAMYDHFNHTVKRNDTLLMVNPLTTTKSKDVHFDPGAPLSVVGVSSDGGYSFSRMSITGEPSRMNLSLLFQTRPPHPDAPVLNATVPTLLLPCPLSFTYSNATKRCEPCHDSEYSFDDKNGCQVRQTNKQTNKNSNPWHNNNADVSKIKWFRLEGLCHTSLSDTKKQHPGKFQHNSRVLAQQSA